MARKGKFDYFDHFQKQADLAVKEAQLLKEAIETWDHDGDLRDILERAHAIEHEGDTINHAICRSVADEFVTPIEREDLLAIASNLDDLIDQIEDVMRLFYMYDIHTMSEDAIRFADIIGRSCEALSAAMADFRNFKHPAGLRESIISVGDIEEEGDQLFMEAIRTLHTVYREETMRVLVWSRIFNGMEKCCDGCEHVADSMEAVILKNA